MSRNSYVTDSDIFRQRHRDRRESGAWIDFAVFVLACAFAAGVFAFDVIEGAFAYWFR